MILKLVGVSNFTKTKRGNHWNPHIWYIREEELLLKRKTNCWDNSGTWDSKWFQMPFNCPKLVRKGISGNFTTKSEWKKIWLIDIKGFSVYIVKAKLGDFVKFFPPGLVHNYLMKSICILSSFIVSCRHSIEAGPTLWGSRALLNCEVIWILEFCG